MSKSFLISLVVVGLLSFLSSYISKKLPFAIFLYCIYEQISFKIKRGSIPGPLIIPPIFGFIYESIYPKMEGYANLWKLGPLASTTVFGKFIVVCNSPILAKQILSETTNIVELYLISSMKEII